MANVDPPISFLDLFREGARWTFLDGTLTPEARNYLEADFDFKYQIRERTGGSSDGIAAITSSESFETSGSSAEYHELSDNNDLIEDLIPFVGQESSETEVISQNATLVAGDIAEVIMGATVTLDKLADAGDLIIAGNGDGSKILINGNGIEIRFKGQRGECVILDREGTFIQFYKIESGSEQYWRAA